MNFKFKKLDYKNLLNKYSVEIASNEPSEREFIYSKVSFNQLSEIDYSIVMPVFNQEDLIKKHIESILKYTKGNYELILILDFCGDNTEKEILNFFSNYDNNYNNLESVTIVKHCKFPIFEASCDNVGFMLAKGKFLLEIQSDMEMTESGYNLQLKRPFDHFDNCIGVSGRCSSNFSKNWLTGCKCHNTLTKVSDSNYSRDIFYQHDTCNRGPLLLDREKSASLSFLNEKDFHLDDADHHFFARASVKNYICGYMAIDYYCEINMGSGRRRYRLPRDIYLTNEEYLHLRQQNYSINFYDGTNFIQMPNAIEHKLT